MPVSQDVSPARPLTVKQKKFAAQVADGQSKAAAHRANYKQSPPGYEMADRRKASEIANQPHIAAEIRRLTWLSCPPLADTAGMRSQAVRVIADLSRSAKSEQVRLNAALALYRIAEQTRAAAFRRTCSDLALRDKSAITRTACERMPAVSASGGHESHVRRRISAAMCGCVAIAAALSWSALRYFGGEAA